MGARLLVLGGGGREHALVWKLARSRDVSEIVCAPGNAGIAALARCEPVDLGRMDEAVALAVRNRADLVLVGPEGPLCAGLADALAERGIPVFGPTRRAAALEGSKIFAKQLMERAGVPTAPFGIAEDFETARATIDAHPGPLVVKADGLCGGKGVIVCDTPDEARDAAHRMLVGREFGAAGGRVIIEERLVGREASILAFCDGERLAFLPAAEDHKAVFDGDRGPNTGGMGAFSPTPQVDEALLGIVRRIVLEPVVRALAEAGHPYRGLLYAGLMLTDRGPMVLEFNCRFGDPETQPVALRLEGDLFPWLTGAAAGRLPPGAPQVSARAAVCVVQCAAGYPGPVQKGDPISGIEEAEALPDVVVFHAATARRADGALVTGGGRVLGTSATGATLVEARRRAYQAVARIRFAGEHHRSDIAGRNA